MTTTTATATDATGRTTMPLLAAAEVALAAVTLATTVGFYRLFAEPDFLPTLLAHATLAHLAVAACRRRGLSPPFAALVCAFAAVLAVCWLQFWSTTAVGIPTSETLRQVLDRFGDSWTTFGAVRAPAPVEPGFVTASALAIWAGAWLADLAAFRLWIPVEALVPSGTLFAFASLFGAGGHRTEATVLYLATAITFVLVHRVARQHGTPAWLGSDPRLGSASLLKVGGALVAATAVLAWVFGPNIPGASSSPLVDWKNLSEQEQARETISPLVEIKGRLVEQPDIEVFTVRTNERAYWRLTSLDLFDGEVWSSRGSYEGASGELDGLGDPPPGAHVVTQRFDITGLATIWLPAAYEPRAVEVGDVEVRWEPESGTLIVSSDYANSNGVQYEVQSGVPSLDAATLSSDSSPPPDDFLTHFTQLPAGFSPAVVAEATNIVAGAVTPFDRARALQDYFRNGSFTYDLNAPAGHSGTAIEQFLFQTRTGFCEQFAGSYAAMARAIGLPTRVAVGFTPGDPDPADPSVLHVRGEHAHAWPEVFFEGAGWVAFEPTPGRGAPGAEGYTGVPEQQDTAGPSTAPTIFVPAVPEPAPQDPNPGDNVDTGSSTTTTSEPAPFDVAPQQAKDPWRFVPWVLIGLGGLLLAALFGAAGILAWQSLRRLRRRARASTPDDVVRVAWAEAIESVGVLGVAPRRHESPTEFASRAASAIDDLRPRPLATVVERAEYSADGVDDDEAQTATELAAGIEHGMKARTSLPTRVRARLDPRPPEHRARRERSSGPRIEIKRSR